MKPTAEKVIREADRMLFDGRVKRYKFFDSIHLEYEGPISSGMISLQYLDEAIRCWLEGQFIATVVMMQMAFEEGLGNTYRGRYLFTDETQMQKKINKMGFHDLIAHAKTNKFLTDYQATRLETLRKMRNPYVHVKWAKRQSFKTSGNSQLPIMLKISELCQVENGMIDESTLERDARKVMRYLKLYYKIFGGHLL